MKIDQNQLTRPITNQDRTQLASLIHFSTYVHRHLDWRTPLDWVGHPPYYALESNQRLKASMACSPDIPKITWIRVFVCDSTITPEKAWDSLWPEIYQSLKEQEILKIAAIPIQKWFRELLEAKNFQRLHNIVTLAWDQKDIPSVPKNSASNIRTMELSDLEQVRGLDQAAFDPLWQHSTDLIKLALSQANYASVCESDGEIIGYQISTPTRYGVHLGRLAVHPKAQQTGVGSSLVADLQHHFTRSGPIRISVNTHDTNSASLALYTKAGFSKTSEAYPVYQYKL